MHLPQLLLYLLAFYICGIECKSSSRNVSNVPCPRIQIPKAVIKYSKKNSNYARVRCPWTHFLIGNNYLQCFGGRWIGDMPKCVSKDPKCKPIKEIPNGVALARSKYNKAVILFFCHPGYKLIGPEALYCMSKTWSNNSLPQCVPLNDTNYGISCDFEKADLCGWTQGINHDFDWRRQNSETILWHIETGTKYDHTYGKNKPGYFMHVQTQNANVGEVARLYSPFFKVGKFKCFEFYYNMYQAKDGFLKVYVRQETEPEADMTARFSITGMSVDYWKRGLISLNDINKPFQIIIEGIRGKTFESNMAIDDVKLLPECHSDSEESIITTTEEITSTSENVETTEEETILSCSDRCWTKDIKNYHCQCDYICLIENNCCPDFIHQCGLKMDTETTEIEIEPTSSFIETTERASTLIRTTYFSSTGKSITVSSHDDNEIPFVQQPIDTETPETIDSSMEVPIDGNFPPNVDTIISMDDELPEHRRYIPVVLIISSVSIVFGVILATIYIMRRTQESNGNRDDWTTRATDVRYLTSDEILDFRLAQPPEDTKDSDCLLLNDSESSNI